MRDGFGGGGRGRREKDNYLKKNLKRERNMTISCPRRSTKDYSLCP